ncbi:transposase [Microbulbifer thermotolerans]
MGSRLETIKKVVRMLKWYMDKLLNYFEHRISNAGSEGVNLKK